MPDHDLRKLDEEDRKLADELRERMRTSQEPLKLEALLGFQLPKTKCFVPSVDCGHIMTPLMSLVPIYENVLLPIHSNYWPYEGNKAIRIEEDSTFKSQHGLIPSDLAILAEKGRVIPYFSARYEYYDEKTIKPLLQPGVPRISYGIMEMIRGSAIGIIREGKNWMGSYELASKDIRNLNFPKEEEVRINCTMCLSVCYMLGLRQHFQKSEFGRPHACFVSYAISTQVLDAVLQTECPLATSVLSNIGDLPEGISIEYILKGLKVNYSPDIPLEDYVDIFDGKTSKALRKILMDLLSDPLSRKYNERLNARIYDLNRQVEELAEGKTAKIFEAISDMALYGGKKFVESQTQRYIKVPKKGFIRLGEWLASKGVDLAAKTQRRDWSIAQLYKARCKLERCK